MIRLIPKEFKLTRVYWYQWNWLRVYQIYLKFDFRFEFRRNLMQSKKDQRQGVTFDFYKFRQVLLILK